MEKIIRLDVNSKGIASKPCTAESLTKQCPISANEGLDKCNLLLLLNNIC